MGIKLNKGQSHAVVEGKRWYNHRYSPLFTIVGPAGSGKTTIIFSLIEELGIDISQVLFVTYVGKASLVMRRNGLPAATIHSTIYDMVEEIVQDEKGKPKRRADGKYMVKRRFKKKDYIPNRIKLIVLDEAGMVPDNIVIDLLSYDVPIIALGDIDQLPAVFGKSTVLLHPNIILTEIMRQAKGDPILHLADLARNKQDIPLGTYGKKCIVADYDILKHDKIFLKPDILICGKNKTRDIINNHVRYDILDRVNNFPVAGDKLVCRKNNWNLTIDEYPLINGMFGICEHVYKPSFNGKSVNIDFRPDFIEDDYFENVKLDYEFLISPSGEKEDSMNFYNGNKFEYGYASTCHLAQGSQYRYVVVLEEKIGNSEFHRKWLYTAITRAKTKLLIVKNLDKWF